MVVFLTLFSSALRNPDTGVSHEKGLRNLILSNEFLVGKYHQTDGVYGGILCGLVSGSWQQKVPAARSSELRSLAPLPHGQSLELRSIDAEGGQDDDEVH